MQSAAISRIGLAGLAAMGQNLAINIACNNIPISVYSRTASKVDETEQLAESEGGATPFTGYTAPLLGYRTPRDFVHSIKRPRSILIMVKAGAPVDQTIDTLGKFMEPGDCIIDGGDEWYENTERRIRKAKKKGLLYLGMGVSGGAYGAKFGPILMPGGSLEAYNNVKDILTEIAAQADDGPCVTYIGKGGSGNFVKMVHDGIEYGNMQLISEAYDLLKAIGKLSNQELADVFAEWNRGELESFLIKITTGIFEVKDEHDEGGLIDKILDKTGMKSTGKWTTGKWTVQQAAELSVAVPTIAAALDCRYLRGLEEERKTAANILDQAGVETPKIRSVDKKRLINDVRQALYASNICIYAQGMNLLGAKSEEKGWNLNLGELARVWKGECSIRAKARFLDRIKIAYERNQALPNLMLDSGFAKEMAQRQGAWRRVVGLAVESGISTPGMGASLSYFDTYRRARLPA